MNVKFFTVSLSLFAFPAAVSGSDQESNIGLSSSNYQRAVTQSITVSSVVTDPAVIAKEELIEEFRKAFEVRSLSLEMKELEGGTTCLGTGPH